MTRGLKAEQLGITPALVDTYGETIFKLSHNHQIRRGDPVRDKDFAAIEFHAHELGLSDAQIASRIGLRAIQVTYIRNLMERRRFRRNHYHRLNQLGGGRRFRADRAQLTEEVQPMGKAARRLRGAMRFRPELVQRYVAEGWWTDDTLAAWLGRNARERPDATAIELGDAQLSWTELAAKVEALAGGLCNLGLGPGDVIGIQLPNTIEFIAAYLAIGRIGAVTTTLYLPHRESEFRHLLGHARARAVFVGAAVGDFSPAATALCLRADLDDLEHVIVVGSDAAPEPDAVSFEALEGAGHAVPDDVAPAASDPFLLLYTSGTTSAPKAVPLSYQNMLSNARLSAPEHGLGPDDRILSVPPFGHLYALYSVHLALYAGAPMVLLPVFSPPALIETLAAKRPTVVFAAPAHMAACIGNQLLTEEFMSDVRLLVIAGSAVPADLARSVQAYMGKGKVCQLWGMTELQAGLYTRLDDSLDVVATSAGRASPGAEVRVADETGRALGAERDGELQIRGCLLFPGYLDNDSANAAAFTLDGWFRTGDLARMDAAGNVAITGRLKDVINRGGVKYNPLDIEALIERYPGVGQCAIVPMPDEILGERACCFITTSGGATPTLEGLCDYLVGKGISKVKLPEKLVVVDEMPLTPTRKIIKGKLPAA